MFGEGGGGGEVMAHLPVNSLDLYCDIISDPSSRYQLFDTGTGSILKWGKTPCFKMWGRDLN